MSQKLHQIVAVLSGKKTIYQKELTDIHHHVKSDSVDGFIKSYVPHDEEDRDLPEVKSKGMAVNLKETISDIFSRYKEVTDLVSTQDRGNCEAMADVIVDDVVILEDVPATTLLYLEQSLTDLRTFVEKLPVLNPIHSWAWDDKRDCYVTEPVKTVRTVKTKKVIEKAKATDKHPAQVEVFDADVPAGTWSTVYTSTALPGSEKKQMLVKIEALRDAIKSARTNANCVDVQMTNYGDYIIDFIRS